MKFLLNILLVLSCVNGVSQISSNQVGSDCGTVVPPVYTQLRNSGNSTQNLVNILKHDTCLNKKFSIAFHVVLDSNYTWGGVSHSDLVDCINSLNVAFSRICVSFEKCYVDSIANYTYNSWEMTDTEIPVLPNWNKENMINIYLVDSILGFPAGYCSSVIVLEKGSSSGSVPVHEMGHFFGLPHTWAETGSPNVFPLPTNVGVGSQEYVRRTNCYTNGDGFCDTEADCYPTGFDKLTTLPCKHVPGTVDGYGDYFVPPVDNYMTYFKCGCRFTQEQYNWMAYVILTSKLYLH